MKEHMPTGTILVFRRGHTTPLAAIVVWVLTMFGLPCLASYLIWEVSRISVSGISVAVGIILAMNWSRPLYRFCRRHPLGYLRFGRLRLGLMTEMIFGSIWTLSAVILIRVATSELPRGVLACLVYFLSSFNLCLIVNHIFWAWRQRRLLQLRIYCSNGMKRLEAELAKMSEEEPEQPVKATGKAAE